MTTFAVRRGARVMRITADRAELAEAVKWVSKATTTAGQWPALAGIRIDASDALDLTGHDQFTTKQPARRAA